MSSAIDPTKPAAGAASTADVRNNFAAAKSEIEALQTGKQAASARLAALAAILLAADKLLYAIGSDSFATADLTAFARTLLASPNAAAARTVLGAAAPAATLSGYGITDAYTKAQTDAAISAGATSVLALFVGSAPAALDTWAELVAAIQADQTGLGALTTAVAGKAAMADVNAAIAFSALTGKPTSLAGYGITDSYTKTEVDTKVAVGAASIGAGDSSLRVTDTGADAGIVVGKIDGVDVMKVGTPASVQPTKNLAGADSTNPNVLTVYAAKGNLRLHAAHGDDNSAAPGQGATALIYGGYASVGSGKAGGSVYLIGGKSDGGGAGGNAGVSAGPSSGGTGGTVYLEGGQGAGFGGPALVRGGPGANGGSVSLIGGDASNGSGGSVLISTPDSVGTNKQGADVIVTVGHGTGTGRHGQLQATVAGDVAFTVGGTFTLNGSRVATVADIPASGPVAFSTLTGKPATLAGYGITDAYTATQVDAKVAAATPTFANLTGKPTTVSGYGITDAYTKAATDSAISAAVTALKGGASTVGDTLKKLDDRIAQAVWAIANIAPSRLFDPNEEMYVRAVSANEEPVFGPALLVGDVNSEDSIFRVSCAEGWTEGTFFQVTPTTATIAGAAIWTQGNHPTSLAGYGIADAYTKTYVDTLTARLTALENRVTALEAH